MSCEQQTYMQGKRLYENLCANCHMEDGSGLSQLIPPLNGADYLYKYKNRIPCIIKYGQSDTIVVNHQVFIGQMPANKELNDVQINNIINYINNSWNNELGYTPLDSIKSWLETCKVE